MNSYFSVFWFRRDLRLDDNLGLNAALSSGLKVIPIFIFDTEIINKLEKYEDALQTLERVPDIQRNHQFARDHAHNLEKRGFRAEAKKVLQDAIELYPDSDVLRANEGLLGLAVGPDEFSFNNYKRRERLLNLPQLNKEFAPIWDGEPLQNQSIFIWGEQGIGDELVFFSALSVLAERNNSCVIACEERICKLLANSHSTS